MKEWFRKERVQKEPEKPRVEYEWRAKKKCKFNFTIDKCGTHIGFYLPLIASIIFCPLYWSIWDKAKDANSEALDKNPDKFRDYPFYETCGMGNETSYEDLLTSGEVRMTMLEFASIFYLLYMLLICCLMCSNCFEIKAT